MANMTRRFTGCTECGGTTPKWQGKCPATAMRRNTWLIEQCGTLEGRGRRARNRFASLAPASEVAVLADIEAGRCRARPPASTNSTACWAAASSKAA
jgi:DNA repair protein RadA/Sms